jgi:hypothetical protein
MSKHNSFAMLKFDFSGLDISSAEDFMVSFYTAYERRSFILR